MRVPYLLTLVSTSVALSSAQQSKCLPGQPCFPSTQQLAAFNASVGGALLKPPPYGAVCYKGTWNQAACSDLVAQKRSPEYRESLPAAVQYPNTEFDEYGKGCPVPDTAPSAPLTGECVLGSLVTYAVKATKSDDIVKTVQFAAKYNLKLVVKNTGHDYFGRSTEAGGFSIWTEHLKSQTYRPDFSTAGCSTKRNMLEAGAGVNVGDIYQAGEQNKVLFNGGYNPTVGACGGYWVFGGIGSPFGPMLGYGADRIAQFEIVLANGTTTIASECQNTDLYWAVKGGGGSFGVVTRVWVLAAPAPKKVNIVYATLSASSSSAYTNLVNAMVDQSPKFRDPATLTSCLMVAVSQGFQVLCVKAFNQSETVVSAAQSASVFDPVRKTAGVTSNFTQTQFDTWYQGYQSMVKSTVQEGAPTGLGILDVSRALTSKSLFTSPGRQSVKDFLLAVDPKQVVILEWNGGFATNNPPTKFSSIHPTFRDSVGYIVSPAFSTSNGPTTSTQNSTIDALSGLLDKYIGSVAYANEDNVRNKDFKQNYWGPNYDRLSSIKHQVDPNNFFVCKNCVS